MRGSRRGRERPPLNEEQLRELALTYVGRFATTRAKLASYLRRKLTERGWAGAGEPAVEAVVERLSELGYVDDAAFALSKARSLTSRGYGERRVRQSLRAAGIAEEDGGAAHELAAGEAVEAALRFARKRRFGPFAVELPDLARRERQLAAMLRAGHPLPLASAIVRLEPGATIDMESLAEKA